MESFDEKVLFFSNAVKKATPAIVITLGELLSTNKSQQTAKLSKSNYTPRINNRSYEGTSRAKKPVNKTASRKDDGKLSYQEKSLLSTEIINVTLKSLSEALKPLKSVTTLRPNSTELIQQEGDNTNSSSSISELTFHSRSSSTRKSSSSNISNKETRTSISALSYESEYKPTAECARIAFSCLRELQSSKSLDLKLPHLHLEHGMSVLITKLISLGMDDLAVKELRILKRCLTIDLKNTKVDIKPLVSCGSNLANLLDFGNIELCGLKLELVITTQLQVLRLIASSKKPKNAELALPILSLTNTSSPIRLIQIAAKGVQEVKKIDKLTRQLQSVTEIILSLCPSVSPSYDALAVESRISLCPKIAIQLQTIALYSRILWWDLARHTGDFSKDILKPFLFCLSAFARRSQNSSSETLYIALEAMKTIHKQVENFPIPSLPAVNSVMVDIFKLLASLAKDAHQIDVAISWIEQAYCILKKENILGARLYGIVARLVTLRLQSSSQDPIVEEQLFALLENLDRPLKGQASEIDDLFIEVSRTRKVALNYLINPPIRPESVPENNSLQEMCRSLVFLCPRLSLRYLGNVPEATATLKDVAQYKKRLQFIYKFSIYAVDSSLYLIKSLLAEGTLKWEFLDFRLQDCLTLLDQIDSQSNEASHHIGQGISPLTHRLRISNLYYSQYLDIRENRSPKTSNQMIKLLCRSIDCIRERPPQERKTALFTAKLERLAELYHNSGQYDELLQHLYTLRNELIQGGVLSAVLSQASSQPLKTAWSSSREISMLGRTIYSILKIQIKLAKSVSQLPLFEETWSNEERAIVLEYELEFLCRYSIAKSNSTIELQRFAFKQLLELYNKSQFPLRRFRVILRFLIAQFGSFDKQFYEAEMELESSIIENLVIQGTEDDGLSKYFIYFKSIAMISKEFNKNQPCLTKLTRGLTILSEILSKCKNLSDLNKQIDDIVALLALLNTINDWLQVHGHDKTRISVLNLITELSEKAEVVLSHDELILNLIKLGTQWLHLGYSGKACQALDRARNFHQKTGSSTLVTLQLQIFASEYFLTIGNLNEVEANLSYTHSIFTKAKEHMIFPKVNSSINQKLNTNLLISSAYTINSKFAFERGLVYPALSYAKQSVRLLRSAWADIEGHTKKQNHVLDKTPSEIERLAGEISNISLSTPSQKLDSVIDSCEDYTSFWAILIPLFRSLNDLSTTYAHHGMFQETIYYAEQAYKLVKQVRSNNYIAISGITLGNIWLRAGNLSKGSELLSEAKLLLSSEVSKEKVLLSYNLGIMNGLLCNFDAEINFYGNAINNLNELLQKEYISSIETFLKPIENYEKKLPNSCETKQKHPQRKLRSNNKSATKINLTTPVRAHFDGISSITNEYPFLLALRSQIIREKSRAFLHQKRWTDASNLLLETETSFSSSDKVGYGLAIGKYLLTQSLSQMDADPVYSILQDSTISFPSVLGSSRFFKNGDKLSAAIVSPKKCVGTRIGTERTNNKISSSDSFFDKLRRAQDYLRETLSIAMVVSPVSIIYKTTHLLNSVAILLSTADQIKAKSSTHPCLSSLLIGMSIAYLKPTFFLTPLETARNLAQQRERKAIQIDPLLKISSNGFCWPQPNLLESKKPSYGFQDDSIAKFEREYIDIIPKLWTVISISLSDSRHELSLIKLQAGSSPFILQLPLGRNSSIDADEEAFNYEQGRAELQEIIRLANESAHDAGNRLGREARISWWNERETLDIRMKDLLKNIEKVWLGGFKGIFSQQIRRADLFARFQKTFQGILDKYLPSRRKGSKRNCVNRITLDSRIFDLFIGLGDMFEEVLDLSEPLTDLLYFVVDILQFHGEFNAYAEIDFDMIVLETTDALRCYHEAIRGTQKVDEGRHTILILDKNLHSFPWESLPCLDGLAVSRLPSLESLRERLIPRPEKSDTSNLDGFFIDRSLGSYVLNPGGDLKHTLRIFKKELQALQGWNGIINREPSEEEFKNNLSNSDLFLYFGHGSGSQYIRAREIQKLSKCAVTILMGCSSGALIETGEFEPYGPPVNYLHAGCHALVATLWDVTDKDIDRFAKRTFENWGLFNSRPELKLDSNGKGKNKNFDEPVITKMPSLSLTEAVAMSRRACNLRYLNAAAVCVYGVPVYFKE